MEHGSAEQGCSAFRLLDNSLLFAMHGLPTSFVISQTPSRGHIAPLVLFESADRRAHGASLLAQDRLLDKSRLVRLDCYSTRMARLPPFLLEGSGCRLGLQPGSAMAEMGKRRRSEVTSKSMMSERVLYVS